MPLRQPPRTLSFCSSPPHESAMVKVQNDTSTTTPLPSYRTTYGTRRSSCLYAERLVKAFRLLGCVALYFLVLHLTSTYSLFCLTRHQYDNKNN
jgi:hypothetical protein